MRILYNNIKLAVCALALTAIGCTDSFEDINSRPDGVTLEELERDFQHVRSLYQPMMENVYQFNPAWAMQIQQNLQGDVYSGYMMPPTPFAGNINNMNYALVDGWNGWAWSTAYRYIMTSSLQVENRAKESTPEFYAWSQILKVQGMHRLTDTYGPIIYSSFADESDVKPYDSQETVYNTFFSELEEAIGILTEKINAGEPNRFAGVDISAYGGDYTQWVKFANSLRLRLAIRISKVNPTLAKTEAEKSLNHSIGVMTSNADNLQINHSVYSHPLKTVSGVWNDCRMGAPMESILVGYDDPRISQYFFTSEIESGAYKGIRNGIEIAAKSDYAGFSPVGEIVQGNTITWMTASEVQFLLAEASLRGWATGGDAKTFYEQGIQMSFDQHGAGDATDYIGNDTNLPIAYVDPVNGDNSTADHISTATIKWDDAASNEMKLEKIITQKWIAMFPDGQEAWSEYRRTNYPKLMPVVVNKSGGTIDTDTHIRRINFVLDERENNPSEVSKAESLLKGPDNGGTRLWWDTGGSNF